VFTPNREKSAHDKYKIRDDILRLDLGSVFICLSVISLRSFLDECLVSNVILCLFDLHSCIIL